MRMRKTATTFASFVRLTQRKRALLAYSQAINVALAPECGVLFVAVCSLRLGGGDDGLGNVLHLEPARGRRDVGVEELVGVVVLVVSDVVRQVGRIGLGEREAVADGVEGTPLLCGRACRDHHHQVSLDGGEGARGLAVACRTRVEVEESDETSKGRDEGRCDGGDGGEVRPQKQHDGDGVGGEQLSKRGQRAALSACCCHGRVRHSVLASLSKPRLQPHLRVQTRLGRRDGSDREAGHA
eukprot:4385060-Pleurochrysis_carterae.AAC.2